MKEGGLLETATKEASALASKVFYNFTFWVALENQVAKNKFNYETLFVGR